MWSSRENLKTIYVFLFLTVAFYILQLQDPVRYVPFFAFDGPRIMAGEVWRLVTFQFVASGMVWLFFDLLILYLMGSIVEEELGTANFLTLFAASVAGSAAVGFLFGFQFIGPFFSTYTLLFVFASLAPETVFYIFFVLPVKVKWLAWIALGFLIVSLFLPDGGHGIAAAAGAAAGYGYFLLTRRAPVRRVRTQKEIVAEARPAAERDASLAYANRGRFAALRKALASSKAEELQAVEERLQREITPGVNICPPVDFKPEDEDGYCVRCDGFAECSLRYLKTRTASSTGA
jgi:membrane associated rhomboid family serine protease